MEILIVVTIVILVILFMVWVYKKVNDRQLTVVLFYANWCPACQATKPKWDAVKTEMSAENDIKFVEIDIDNKELAAAKEKEYGVSVDAVPTIVVAQGFSVEKYEGSREKEHLSQFLWERVGRKYKWN